MGKDQEIIQEYFTKYYPVKKKYIYNEMDVASLVSGMASAGIIGIVIMIFLLLIRKSNVVTGEVSNSISNSKRYRELAQNHDELQNQLKDAPLDEKSKKEYSNNLDEIKKLREEIKQLQEERKQETETFKRFFEKIKSKEIDKDNILNLIQEIMDSGDPDEIKQKLEEIKKEVEESKLSKDEIDEIEGYIKKVETSVKKEQGLLSKIAQKIKDFCMGSFETISSLMKSGGKKVKEGLSKFWGKVTSTFGGLFDKKLDMALNNIKDSISNGKNILLKVKFKLEGDNIGFEIIESSNSINDSNFIYLVDKKVLILHDINEKRLFVSDNIENKDLENFIQNLEIDITNFNPFGETLESQTEAGDGLPISVEKINTEYKEKQNIKIKFTLTPDANKKGMIDIFQDREENESDGNYIHFPLVDDFVKNNDTKQYQISDDVNFVELIKNYDQEFEYEVEYVEIEDEEDEEVRLNSNNSIVDSIKLEILLAKQKISKYITDEEIKIKDLIDDKILKVDGLVNLFEEKDIKDISEDPFTDSDDIDGDAYEGLGDDFNGEEDFLGPDPLDNSEETKNESFKNKKLNSILNEMFYSDIKRTHKFYFEEVNMQEPIEVTKKAGKKIVITHKFPQIIKIKDLNEFEPSNVYKINLQKNEIEKIISLKDFNLKNHFNSIILYQYKGKDIHIGQLIIDLDKIGEDKLIYQNILEYFDEKVSEIASVTEEKMSRDDLKKFLAANPVEIKINDNFLNEIKFEILRKGEISSKKIKENEKADEIIKDLTDIKNAIVKNIDLDEFLNNLKYKTSDKDELQLKQIGDKNYLDFNLSKERVEKLNQEKGWIKGFHPDSSKEIELITEEKQKDIFVPIQFRIEIEKIEDKKFKISKNLLQEIFIRITTKYKDEKEKETKLLTAENGIDLDEFLNNLKYKKSNSGELQLKQDKDKNSLIFDLSKERVEELLTKNKKWMFNFAPDKAKDSEFLFEQEDKKTIIYNPLKFEIEIEKTEDKKFKISKKILIEIFTKINSSKGSLSEPGDKKIGKEETKTLEDKTKKDLEEKTPEKIETSSKEDEEKYFLSLEQISGGSRNLSKEVDSENGGIIFIKKNDKEYKGILWIKNDITKTVDFSKLKKLSEYFNISIYDYILNEAFEIKDYQTGFVSDFNLTVELMTISETLVIKEIKTKGNLQKNKKDELIKGLQSFLRKTIGIQKDDPEYENKKQQTYNQLGLKDFEQRVDKDSEIFEGTGVFYREKGKKVGINIIKNQNKLSNLFNQKDKYELFYYINVDGGYYYINLNDNIVNILNLLKSNKKIKIKNENLDITSMMTTLKKDSELFKKFTSFDKNKIYKTGQITFGKVRETKEIKKGNKDILAFILSTNPSELPKISETEEKMLEQDSYMIKNLDSIIINEVFKKWKK